MPGSSNSLLYRYQVCHCFADLIQTDLYLRYRVKLAQCGMADGSSRTLPVSERLQRLRRYSSNFRHGIFEHENVYKRTGYRLHTDGIRRGSHTTVYDPKGSAPVLYRCLDPPFGSFLSVVTYSSAQAGILSRHEVIPFGAPEDADRVTREWAMDEAQDLLVIAEIAPAGTENKLVSINACQRSD